MTNHNSQCQCSDCMHYRYTVNQIEAPPLPSLEESIPMQWSPGGSNIPHECGPGTCEPPLPSPGFPPSGRVYPAIGMKIPMTEKEANAMNATLALHDRIITLETAVEQALAMLKPMSPCLGGCAECVAVATVIGRLGAALRKMQV